MVGSHSPLHWHSPLHRTLAAPLPDVGLSRLLSTPARLSAARPGSETEESCAHHLSPYFIDCLNPRWS